MSEYVKEVKEVLKKMPGQEYVYNYEICLFNEKRTYKNIKKCEKLREDGNNYYKNKEFMNAIISYTESIAYGPFYCDALAKAFGNRSAVLLECGMYEEAIKDIENAYEHGYSITEAKMSMRLAFCYYILNNEDKLNDTINTILFLSTTYTDKDSIMKNLKSRPRKEKLVTYFYRTPPPLSFGRNKEIPCASKAVDIVYNDDHGQHLIAARDINMGDILMVEKPFVQYLNEDQIYYYCTHCMNFCVNLIPCKRCYCTMYCSKECQEQAEIEYHQRECLVFCKFICKMDNRTDFTVDSMIIRTICKLDFATLEHYINRMKEPKGIKNRTSGFKGGVYDPSNFETVFNMRDVLKTCDKSLKEVLVCKSYMLVKCFNLIECSVCEFTALIFKLQLIYAVHSCGIDKYAMHKSKFDIRGNMICPGFTDLRAKHCISNSSGVPFGNKMAVVAVVPIKKGQAITLHGLGMMKTDEHAKAAYKRLFGSLSVCNCKTFCMKDIIIGENNLPCLLPISQETKSTLNQMLDLGLNILIFQNRVNPNEKEFTLAINKFVKLHEEFIRQHYFNFPLDPLLLDVLENFKNSIQFYGNIVFFKPKDNEQPQNCVTFDHIWGKLYSAIFNFM